MCTVVVVRSRLVCGACGQQVCFDGPLPEASARVWGVTHRLPRVVLEKRVTPCAAAILEAWRPGA